jgi:hypothetical protein
MSPMSTRTSRPILTFDVDEECRVADTFNFLQGMIADGLAQVVEPTGDRVGAPS